MKNKNKKVRFILFNSFKFFCAITAILLVFHSLNSSQKSPTVNPTINISELPKEFIDNYLTDYAEIAQKDDKGNILIVTSLSPLESSFGAESVISAPNNQYFLQYSSESEKRVAFQQLQATPNLSVTENHLHQLYDDEEGTTTYNSWGIQKMGLDHAKELVESYPEHEEVVVAIVDTGLDTNLFNKNYPDKLAGTYDILNPNGEMSDRVGHGSHVAGTIAEGTPDNVKIFPVKISNTGQIFTTDIISAINYITYYEKADVINMSFGGYFYEEPEYTAIEAAKNKNIIGVASAGNENTNSQSYPAAFDNTISISAVDEGLHLADFSNFGSTITYAAPGVGIKSINGVMDGTSMAAPHASSAVAIAKSFNRALTLDNTISFLNTRTIDLGISGHDTKFGYGFIDFNGAELCENASTSDCDQFAIFKQPIEDGIEVAEIILTPYNYGSLTNILATKINILDTSGNHITKALGDFGTDIEIGPYNPYSTEEQTISIAYNGFTTSFKVTNPENWESGWKYETIYNYETQAYDNIALSDYRDHNLDIKTLYLPETIDDRSVVQTYSGCLFNGSDEWITCDYPVSTDALYYETLILPHSLKSLRGFYGDTSTGKFQNLYRIISLADELEVGNMGLAYLTNLVEIEANIVFTSFNAVDLDGNEYTNYEAIPFQGDTSLTTITLSDNNLVIPAGAFSDCKSLENLTLPTSLTEIQNDAFSGSGIITLNLGDHLTKIGDQAFSRSNLRAISIPASVTEIGSGAFSHTQYLETINVSPDNPVFDSRNNSNAIIQTAENKIIVGTINTTFPSTVRTIGSYAFDGLETLEELDISESNIETIESNAFKECFYLSKITLPRTLAQINDDSFIKSGIGTPSKTVFWVYNNTYAKDRVIELDYPYVIIDEANPNPIIDATFKVVPEGRTFYAFDTINSDNFLIQVYYYDPENGVIIEEPEAISNYQVTYNGGDTDSLVGGTNIVVFTFDTTTGYHDIKIELWLDAEYLTPEYEIPSNITAYSGQFLSEIPLPEGFNWEDENEVVEETKSSYLASYTPEDILHYHVVDEIPIPITIIESSTLSLVFPDPNLRSCVVDSFNEANHTTYTEQTIPPEDLYTLTSLACHSTSEADAITDARGVEKLTELKVLDLSDNDITKINLSKNTKLENLNLRSNKITTLDITNNPNINTFSIDETKLEPEQQPLVVKSPAYVEAFYPEEGDGYFIMDLSMLKFLENASFSIEDDNAVYDPETMIIRWATFAGTESLKIVVTEPSGEISTYNLYQYPRNIYISIFLDEKPYIEEDRFGYSYTGAEFLLDEMADYFRTIYNLTDYAIENISIAQEENIATVGQDDIKISFYFKKITNDDTDPPHGDDDDPQNPDNPGGNNPTDNPTDPSDNQQNPGDSNNQNSEHPEAPDTGVFTQETNTIITSAQNLCTYCSLAFITIISIIAISLSKKHHAKLQF